IAAVGVERRHRRVAHPQRQVKRSTPHFTRRIGEARHRAPKGHIHITLPLRRRHKAAPIRRHMIGTISRLATRWGSAAGGLRHPTPAQRDRRRGVAGIASHRDTSADAPRCRWCKHHIQGGRLARRQGGVGADSACAVTRARGVYPRYSHIRIPVVAQRNRQQAAVPLITFPKLRLAGFALSMTVPTLTVSVARLLVAFPIELLTTTSNVAPLSAIAVAGVV